MNPFSNMTYDFFMGQLRLIAVGIIAWCGGKGWLTTVDASAATALLVPFGLLLGPWLWSLYRNFGMKLVPHDSIAIQSNHIGASSVEKGDELILNGGTTAKVVGCLLAALLFSVLAWQPTFAQTRMPQSRPQQASDPLSGFRKFAVTDIQAALDDATENNDTAAIACWSAMLPIVSKANNTLLPSVPGFFSGIQKARDVVRSVAQVKAGIGPLADLKDKCASIVIDTNTFLLKLGIIGGGAAVGLPF